MKRNVRNDKEKLDTCGLDGPIFIRATKLSYEVSLNTHGLCV